MTLGLSLAGALLVGGAGAVGASSSHVAKGVVLDARESSYGTILASGNTLYALKPSSTNCAAACWKIWPELTLPIGVSAATAGKGVTASKIGVVHRAGGVRQVTYGGKPLYYFAGDTKPGVVKGDVTDTWGKWYPIILSTKGAGSGGATTTTTSPGGGGVGF
jgi:predicted lipoprotein with Yx(FWY)xxD motif